MSNIHAHLWSDRYDSIALITAPGVIKIPISAITNHTHLTRLHRRCLGSKKSMFAMLSRF